MNWHNLHNAEKKHFDKNTTSASSFYLMADMCEAEGLFNLYGCSVGEELYRQIKAGDVKRVADDYAVCMGVLSFYGSFKDEESEGEGFSYEDYKETQVAMFGEDEDVDMVTPRIFKVTVTR